MNYFAKIFYQCWKRYRILPMVRTFYTSLIYLTLVSIPHFSFSNVLILSNAGTTFLPLAILLQLGVVQKKWADFHLRLLPTIEGKH